MGDKHRDSAARAIRAVIESFVTDRDNVIARTGVAMTECECSYLRPCWCGDIRREAEAVALRVYPEPHLIHMRHAYADAYERGYRAATDRTDGSSDGPR